MIPCRLAIHTLALLMLLLSGLAMADPPARVGRLAHFEGDVYMASEAAAPDRPATLNWPVSSDARLVTGRRGRAEVWIASTAYRLDADSRLEFVAVDDRQISLRLDQGSLAVSIFAADQAADISVHTPDGSIRFAAPGRYRIDVFDERSELAVQAGRASAIQHGRPTPVGAGQRASFARNGGVHLEPDGGTDAFDDWVAERENLSMAGPARQHVSPYMTGYQDLDAYGDWRPVAEYGTVWYPRAVAIDWAPYRFGRWAWIDPWGWTWIDQAPWGFAPFHYGRWVLIHGRWAWVPGLRSSRPVYAPALVGWIGNPGWNVSFSFGAAPAVGWFPLAPREVYVPGYRHSTSYVRRINATHVHEAAQIERAVRNTAERQFVHRASPQAVTVVPASQVRDGRPIGTGQFHRADRLDLGRAPRPMAAPNPDWLTPGGDARRPSDADRRPPTPPRPESRNEAYRPMPPERPLPHPENPLPRREFRDERPAFQPPPVPERDLRRPDREAAPVFRAPPAPQAMPSPERDFRREQREMQRQERPAPREMPQPAWRPPEPPQFRAPPAPPQPMRPPEPPRPMPSHEPRGEPQGGRPGRGDERGRGQ